MSAPDGPSEPGNARPPQGSSGRDRVDPSGALSGPGDPGVGQTGIVSAEPPGPLEVTRPRELMNPMTSVMVPADDMAAVAEVLVALREHKTNVDAAISAFTDAVVEQSRLAGTKTFDLGHGQKLVLSGESTVEWDVSALSRLRDLGLPETRMLDLVKTTVTYKVDGAVARQIAGSNPEYARVIEAAKIRVPKKPSASVKRA